MEQQPNTPHVFMGQAYAERHANEIVTWGSVQLRSKEFEAVPGVRKDKSTGHYYLPLTTPDSLVAELTAPVYAAPLPGLEFTREKSDYNNSVRYSTTYKGEKILFWVWSEAVNFVCNLTINGVLINASMNFDLLLGDKLDGHITRPTQNPQDRINGVYVVGSVYHRRVHSWDDVSEAAQRSIKSLFGSVLAAFLQAVPGAHAEAEEVKRVEDLVRINEKITQLQKEVGDLMQERARLLITFAPSPEQAEYSYCYHALGVTVSATLYRKTGKAGRSMFDPVMPLNQADFPDHPAYAELKTAAFADLINQF